jgi:hypothetical protein
MVTTARIKLAMREGHKRVIPSSPQVIEAAIKAKTSKISDFVYVPSAVIASSPRVLE